MPQIVFRPTPKQKEFLEALEPEVMYSGAFGAGKSRILCEKAYLLSVYYPGNVGLISRAYNVDIEPTTLKTLLEEVIPPDHLIAHNKSKQRITLRSNDPETPSEIYYRGLDRPTGVASMNLGWAAVDEAIEVSEDAWIMLEGRLRLNRVPFHQIFTATNPGAPSHWLYNRFYKQGRGIDGKLIRRVVDTNALDNPHNPPSFHERLKRFTGIYKSRFVDGKWVGAEGLVFDSFDPTIHVVEPFEIPSDWARYRTIDLGTANPFVCLWWAKDPVNDALYAYREIYMSNRTVDKHALTMHRVDEALQGFVPTPEQKGAALRANGKYACAKCGKEGGEEETFWHSGKPHCARDAGLLYAKAYQWTVCDHDLGERRILAANGIETVPARKDVGEGIQLVGQRLAKHAATGKPRLFFFSNTLVEEDIMLQDEKKPWRTTDEFGLYKWKKNASGTITKDEPEKVHDHGMDTTRYLVMGIDKGSMKAVNVLDGWFAAKPGASRRFVA